MGCFCLPAASAQDARALWEALAQPQLDPDRSTAVKDLTLVRDQIRITLTSGSLHFLKPIAGSVLGAEFRGAGRIEVAASNAAEQQQLRLLAKLEAIQLDFTEAVFMFTDATFEEVTAKAQWASGAQISAPATLFIERQQAREDVGAELLPKFYQYAVSSSQPRAQFFAADLKTVQKGWIHARFDGGAAEEITVGRWNKTSGITRFETWLNFPAAGADFRRAYQDPLAREPFAIRGYQIEARVGEDEVLAAISRVAVEPRAGERALVFELDANLRVEAVRSTAGEALLFFQPRDPQGRDQSFGDYVVTVLPKPAAAGERVTLEFKYSGKRLVRRMGKGVYFCQSYGWYPTRPSSFATRADFELNFRIPRKYALIATGSKIDETFDGDWALSRWKSDVPLAVAGFAFGDFKIHEEQAGKVAVKIFANREPDDSMEELKRAIDSFRGRQDVILMGGNVGTLVPATMAKTMGAEIANSVRLFENYFGPYPYKHLAMTSIPYTYGQGWPSLIYLSALSFLDSTQRNALGLKDHVWLSDFWRAHEVSHQWWGHRVTWKSYRDQWLSEGFAQFSGNLYVHLRRDMNEYLARLRKDKSELLSKDEKGHVYESLGPLSMGVRLSSAESPAGYGVVIYNKGGLVLHMLRMMLFDPANAQNPEHRFMAMLQDFCRTYDNKAASTEDFRAIAEKYMTPAMNLEGNGKLDWFFRQYVHSTGIPQYEFSYTTTAEGDKTKISGSIKQSGVPEGWKDILPLYVQAGGRTALLGWTRATQRVNRVEFTLPFRPEKIVLNHYEDVFADIKQ